MQVDEAASFGSKGLEIWDNLANRFPNSVEYRRRIAREHANQGNKLQRISGKGPEAEAQFRKSLALWESFRQDYPELPIQQREEAHTHHWLASLLLNTDRYEEAETLIRQAYILQPNEASIVDSMGWIAYRLGRNQEALQFLARAWELDRNPEIAAHLGEVLWASGQKEEARGIWQEGVEIDATNYVLVKTLERLGVEL